MVALPSPPDRRLRHAHRGIAMFHVKQDGRLTEHPVAAGARLSPEGVLIYDLP